MYILFSYEGSGMISSCRTIRCTIFRVSMVNSTHNKPYLNNVRAVKILTGGARSLGSVTSEPLNVVQKTEVYEEGEAR
jgi:hypothetical protein